MRRGICQGCGAEVLWVRTSAGARMPIDAEPVWIRTDMGHNTFVRTDGSFAFGMKAGDADDDPAGAFAEVHESHFATCPVGGKFRRPRERKRPKGYR